MLFLFILQCNVVTIIDKFVLVNTAVDRLLWIHLNKLNICHENLYPFTYISISLRSSSGRTLRASTLQKWKHKIKSNNSIISFQKF